jgi:hypothetical protein
MARVPHRIRRQSLVIRTRSATDAFELRRHMRQAWTDVLLPALEQAFDEAADPDQVIRIPRLEVRLRLASTDAVRHELPRMIETAVAEQLRARHDASVTSTCNARAASDARRTIVQYLRTGSVPWEAAGQDARKVIEELLAAVSDPIKLIDDLGDASDRDAYCFRLLQLLDAASFAKLLAALPTRVPRIWARVLGGVLGGAGERSIVLTSRYTQLQLAASLLSQSLVLTGSDAPAAIIATTSRISGEATADDVVRALLTMPEAPTAWKQSVLLDSSRAPEASSGEKKRKSKTTRARSMTNDGITMSPENSGSNGPSLDEARNRTNAASSNAVDDAKLYGINETDEATARTLAAALAARPAMMDMQDTSFGTSVHYAGLILLHPFIGALFEHARIREGDTIPAHSLPRAAALLHYLATGEEDVVEIELGLIKVLLGLTPDASLPVAHGLLLPADREEADAVLDAGIRYWSGLKNTSRAGLRQTFLQRAGLLRRKDEGWLLHVERASFDVLLDYLPWTIGIFKLPWMAERMYTEWPTS